MQNKYGHVRYFPNLSFGILLEIGQLGELEIQRDLSVYGAMLAISLP